MYYLVILGLMVPCSLQIEAISSRCDEPRTVQHSTVCTSYAAAQFIVCPRGYRRTTTNAECRYSVEIGDRLLELPGWSRSCEKVITVKRCCPGFWGPWCLSCPSWSEKVCNWHGTCSDRDSGNGTCTCEEGFTGHACEKCSNTNAYGEHCSSVCTCAHGECNSGPDGDGQCYCQPPYAGPNCDKVSASCSSCTPYSYCKGEVQSAVCECLPGFKKVGHICTGVCSPSVCDVNADCSYAGSGQFQCTCKDGYEGNGKICTPVDPCAQNNGGCPSNSTVCEYTGPGKSRCVCLSGMEGANPAAGCTLKSACTEGTCHRSAQCETSQDGLARCLCGRAQIRDGKRCYGNIMERVLELDREGSQAGKLTGTIVLFVKGCDLIVRKHGPFTAFIPVDTSQISVDLLSQPNGEFCKHHLILGQRLYKDLEGQDLWTYGGAEIRFKANKQLISMKDPDTFYTIIQSDIPAANGIIHIVDKVFTFATVDTSSNAEFSSKTIGDIITKDDRFNRFVSLVDNCGAPMPLRGPGPLTVFIPTNKAVDKFRDGSLIYMLSDAKHKLQELLKHHMFSQAAMTVDQLASMNEIRSMASQTITINVTGDGRVFLGEKRIPLEYKDIVASNGIIHLIDGLLVPPSILPIMPHRCDVNDSIIIMSPCVMCTRLSETHCPPGSIEMPSTVKDCIRPPDARFSYPLTGCAKYCNVTRMRPECCKGFFGPDCKPCIGGFQNPCYDKGQCADGILGDGTCKCNPGFKGIGCHICSDSKKHGENCDDDCHCVHGQCDSRPGSQGVCRRGSCLQGYSGELCDQADTPCNSDGTFERCHIYAHCTYTNGQTMCVCNSGYEGDGYSCTEANLCLKPDRGGCNVNAQCVYISPGNVSCMCNEGWTGDGIMCSEVNNCLLDNRGGCHKDADCIPTGPGQNECSCKKGYMGDGFICQIVNPCLTDNGGCHPLAACSFKNNEPHACTCPEGYEGDGMICYGNILMELDAKSSFISFNRHLQRHQVISADSNVTALVSPFGNLSAADEAFWLDYYRLPHLLQAHFLDGVYSYEDLQKQVNKTVPTIMKTKWKITSKDGKLMIGNAEITVPNLKAINGYIHIIDRVLYPPVSDIPPPPHDLMEGLNNNPSFSLFTKAAKMYNLSEIITSKGFTIFVPHDRGVQIYLNTTNSTQLSEDIIKYHVILNEQLFPEHLTDGTLKSTILGSAYQVMIHLNKKNETMINDVPLDGNFTEVRFGTLIGIPQVLQIHKNHCSKDVFLKVSGRCGACDSTPKCFNSNSKPTKAKFPSNMKSNCKYRTRVRKKRQSVPGCRIDCLTTTKDHHCCLGYYGHDCFKCPGTVDNWCSNNGKCNDGISGNGECLCNEGFHGTACEMCEAGRYGKDCKLECHCEHGKCLDGLDGNGQCICYKGWKGVNCSVVVVNDECGGICDENANCLSGGSGGKPKCVCVAGYQGNGSICKEIDLCATNNGGCSEHASCTKTTPGERSCTCIDDYTGDGIVCVELNPCLVNNGGCSETADCVKTGPNTAACVCKPGYAALGRICSAINPCLKDNGECNVNAICQFVGPGERNCTCRYGYKGDGLQCAGTITRELLHLADAAWFRRNLAAAGLRDLYGKGPYTIFVPHTDYIDNSTIEQWQNKSRSQDLLRYHIVGCEELSESDLKSTTLVITTSGHKLHFSVQDGVVYINNRTKIITSDHECSNGIMHFIDSILLPYDLMHKPVQMKTNLNVTYTAEAYGYTMFSKLLQQANLINMVQHVQLFPFTMFWPTDNAFNSLPEEQKNWLYSEDHLDKLRAYIKVHIVRDQRTVASYLPKEKYVRTMYGTQLTFNCDKNVIGDILINGNDAKIIERHILFDSGIAYGIDKVLEPPNMGAHCDDFKKIEIQGRCGSCLFPPRCPYGSGDTNKTSGCRPIHGYGYRHRHFFDDDLFHSPYPYRRSYMGCNRVCTKTSWVSQCCKNHYGRDCQACPGGLEAPCGEHGDCDDGRNGKGTCNCHTGFYGSSCVLCRTNYFGPNCTACNCTYKGKCDDGLEGEGSCFCQEGWTGKWCESKIEVIPVCNPECSFNAVCLPENQCECTPPYEGNGLNCTAPDLCSEYNGGCHTEANCTQTGVNVTCFCKTGYTGDGYSCSPINRCVEEVNGGCSDFANCIVTGPNERRCECLPGYVGNGVQCHEKVVPPIDRCLEDNGGCDAKAICKDLHFHTKTAGVFHLRSPAGKYKMNYTTAEAACQAEDATLATLSQLSDAQQLGMHVCVAGWFDGKKVGYPIRFPSVKCGDNHVGIVLYKDPVDLSSTYDAYCFSIREVSCECGPGYIGNGEFCNGNLASVIATSSNFSVFYSTLVKYAETAEEGKTLLAVLSDRSSNTTLFVPHNAGFSGNETLSWRDMEYHISTNNSLHFYEDLQHNTAIPSRLGYNLVVMIALDNTTEAEDSPPLKLVNKQIILDWNIPATNGLIHVIQGPLRAPPLPVMPPTPSASHSKSSASTVTTILLIIFIGGVIAGVAYYFLKYRNDAFHFQYFKNDDEDGASTKTGKTPAILSIPNPLYTGYRAFTEPFGEPEQAESPATDAEEPPNLLD